MTVRHLFRPASPEPSNLHNPFLNLPPELILTIADFLNQESKVLLSLSCKYLRLLLNTHLDLSLCDLAPRTKFLQYLETDHPELLTCRVCGWMYHWRRNKCISYGCSRSIRHPLGARGVMTQRLVSWWSYVYMKQELRDLVLRAYRRGPEHGVPLSFLNLDTPMARESMVKMHPAIVDTRLQTQARIIKGQLMLSSCWTIDMNSIETLRVDLGILNHALCAHFWEVIADGLWWAVLQKVPNVEDTEQSISQKCSFCATDYKINLQKIELGGLRIALKTWRNFGNGYSDTQEVEQIFRGSHDSRIDADTVSRRDLETAFISEG